MGIRRVFEVLDTAPEVEDDPDGLKEPLRGDVQFDDVSFSQARRQRLNGGKFAAKPVMLRRLLLAPAVREKRPLQT